MLRYRYITALILYPEMDKNIQKGIEQSHVKRI